MINRRRHPPKYFAYGVSLNCMVTWVDIEGEDHLATVGENGIDHPTLDAVGDDLATIETMYVNKGPEYSTVPSHAFVSRLTNLSAGKIVGIICKGSPVYAVIFEKPKLIAIR